MVKETFDNDIASLNVDLKENLDEDEMEECVEDELEEMLESPEHKAFEKCAEKYSEEEVKLVDKIVAGISGFKCFQKSFDEACRSYVDESFLQPLIESLLSLNA